MEGSFLLLDPGVALPPSADDGIGNHGYWSRLIGWAYDRRSHLGQLGHGIVIDRFTERGWPAYDLPFCPDELSRAARNAVGLLLSRIATIEEDADCECAFDPTYVFDESCALSLSLDVKCRFATPLLGLGSHETHWSHPCSQVDVAPGPPGALDLIYSAGDPMPRENDLRVARELRDMRVNIVGGLRNDALIGDLEEAFEVPRSAVRWTEAEPGQEPRLDAWSGMSPDRDIACVVIGTKGVLGLGHRGSEKAERMARSAGVVFVKARTPPEVLNALRSRFGRAS